MLICVNLWLKVLTLTLTFIWFIVVAFLSLAPLPIKHYLRTSSHLHYPAHFLIYALGAALIGRTRPRRALYLILFAAATEYLQARIYHNPYEWRDLAIDTAAIALTYLCQSAFIRG